MFSSVIFAGNGGLYIGTDSGGRAVHETLAGAKKAAENYITTNKSTFQNGYEVYVLDREGKALVSTASVAPPTLSWVDAVTTEAPPAKK